MRTTTLPRYEIQLCVGGVWCALIESVGTVHRLSPPCGFPSVETAMKAINRHAGREIEYQFDQGIGWAPAKAEMERKSACH